LKFVRNRQQIRIKTNRRSASKPTVDPHQNQLHIRIKTNCTSASKPAADPQQNWQLNLMPLIVYSKSPYCLLLVLQPAIEFRPLMNLINLINLIDLIDLIDPLK